VQRSTAGHRIKLGAMAEYNTLRFKFWVPYGELSNTAKWYSSPHFRPNIRSFHKRQLDLTAAGGKQLLFLRLDRRKRKINFLRGLVLLP